MARHLSLKEASGKHAAVCSICLQDDEESLVGRRKGSHDLRLGCGCPFHFSCFAHYVLAELGDREALLSRTLKNAKLGGIMCPNRRSGACAGKDADGVSDYFIRASDLESLIAKRKKITSSGGSEQDDDDVQLTQHEVDKLRRFLSEQQDENDAPPQEQNKQSVSDEEATQRFIELTTKLCPKPGCGNRESHMHGHHCHHVRLGCSKCKTQYCFQCLATAEENTRERGSEYHCKCGSWSRFCNSDDMKTHLVMEPYPHDDRCGCIICPECRFGEPCGTCDGDCVVCLGILDHGPSDFHRVSSWSPYASFATASFRNCWRSVFVCFRSIMMQLLRAFCTAFGLFCIIFPMMGAFALFHDDDVCAHDGQTSSFWLTCLHLYMMPLYAVCVTCGDASFLFVLAIYALTLLRELHNDMVSAGSGGEGALCEASKDTLLWYWAYIVLFISYIFLYLGAALFIYQCFLNCIFPAVTACCSNSYNALASLMPNANNERNSLLARAAGADRRGGYDAIV